MVRLKGGAGKEDNDEMLFEESFTHVLYSFVNCRVSLRIKLILKLIITLKNLCQEGYFYVDVYPVQKIVNIHISNITIAEIDSL